MLYLKSVIQSKSKVLIIRFSSFGDVTQCLSVPSKLKPYFEEIHWVTREDMSPLLSGHPAITKVFSLEKKKGLKGLFELIHQLRQEKYSHIYDAHNNLRSRLISWFLTPPLALDRFFDAPLLIRKSQKRWKRFLLFQLRKNTYRMPFSGQRDLLEPLSNWGIDESLPPTPQFFVSTQAHDKITSLLKEKNFSQFIALGPSAAFELKRWPLDYWKTLIHLFPKEKFVVLGGPTDHFLQELVAIDPSRVLNLAGETNFQETGAVVALSKALVVNDTGILHIGEQLGKSTIALMGPAPFGFPSRPTTKIMELYLSCRPCSKHGQGPCVNEKYQRCLVDITPELVQLELQRILAGV